LLNCGEPARCSFLKIELDAIDPLKLFEVALVCIANGTFALCRLFGDCIFLAVCGDFC
jgi:hypothetical protein